MAQAIEDILKELDAGYNPSRQLIQQKLDALPGQADTQIQGLNAQKDAAFGDILNGARDRGMGFSGIPLAEQAKYTATDFLPAVAKVRQSQNDTQGSLLGALNDIGLDQRKTAYGIQTAQQANDIEAAKARAAARAASASGGSDSLASLFGGAGGAPPAAGGPAAAAPKATQRADKGFNFVDANGKAISAAQYAQLYKVPLRSLLADMASKGDNGAKQALSYVGNDFNYNAAKVGSNKAVVNLLNSLLWGVNSVKAAAAPAPAKRAPALPIKTAASRVNLFNNPLALRR